MKCTQGALPGFEWHRMGSASYRHHWMALCAHLTESDTATTAPSQHLTPPRCVSDVKVLISTSFSTKLINCVTQRFLLLSIYSFMYLPCVFYSCTVLLLMGVVRWCVLERMTHIRCTCGACARGTCSQHWQCTKYEFWGDSFSEIIFSVYHSKVIVFVMH